MNRFIFIVPVYNSQKYIIKCIDSIINQIYQNWKLIILDDASTDNTGIFVNNYTKDKRVVVIHNKKNVGALKNIVDGISKMCQDKEEIIVLVDGDDWLPSNNILNILNSVYSNKNIWMSYGQMKSVSNSPGGSCPLTNTREYRGSGKWYTTHLRTFKKKIWDKIKNKDLRDETGKYYKTAWDLGILFPLIEMCGIDRIKFIKRIMYVYNDLNPIGDTQIHSHDQIITANKIRLKPQYDEIVGEL